jgi:hypothetical protein
MSQPPRGPSQFFAPASDACPKCGHPSHPEFGCPLLGHPRLGLPCICNYRPVAQSTPTLPCPEPGNCAADGKCGEDGAQEQPWGTQNGPCPRCGHAERHYWSVTDAVCDGCGGRCSAPHVRLAACPPVVTRELARAREGRNKAEAERDALRRIVEPLTEFWLAVREGIFDGIEGAEAQEIAEGVGLLVEVVYDPAVHGEIEDAEPGDTVYVDSPVAEEIARWAKARAKEEGT